MFMKLHFKAKYNMTYITSTSCEVKSLINGFIDISEYDICDSQYENIDKWLEAFVENDKFFGELTNIEWNKLDMKDLEQMFKHESINS